MESQGKEGSLRLMTQGEIMLAKSLYGNSIKYNQVWVHCDSYLPFGLQNENTAMAPNGEIYFRKEKYYRDFSHAPVRDKHIFLHEMMHVWQHQKGYNVRLKGMFSWASNYHYTLGDALLDYPLEQQAGIVSDYWLLEKHGITSWEYYTKASIITPRPDFKQLMHLYKQTIGSFLYQGFI
ncbi:type IV secretion protein Rhs [Enterobacteriaceae bacterium H11S18]|uniref:type IV secretion protein Rhs n=1 Tax=Dryocola clanedunensis TaxID=2925396 RepID=UPI0022F0DDD1|nr:type IV secretion protein Rhs [Dryocola clanedunensis]MCT4710845.1 type IV secretion protein Rhs [Dryocola clanedunensis]